MTLWTSFDFNFRSPTFSFFLPPSITHWFFGPLTYGSSLNVHTFLDLRFGPLAGGSAGLRAVRDVGILFTTPSTRPPLKLPYERTVLLLRFCVKVSDTLGYVPHFFDCKLFCCSELLPFFFWRCVFLTTLHLKVECPDRLFFFLLNPYTRPEWLSFFCLSDPLMASSFVVLLFIFFNFYVTIPGLFVRQTRLCQGVPLFPFTIWPRSLVFFFPRRKRFPTFCNSRFGSRFLFPSTFR